MRSDGRVEVNFPSPVSATSRPSAPSPAPAPVASPFEAPVGGAGTLSRWETATPSRGGAAAGPAAGGQRAAASAGGGAAAGGAGGGGGGADPEALRRQILAILREELDAAGGPGLPF
jgi:hypothetical protein